ncbi:hypothetical protein, partial [Rothia mucilaginosa]
RDIHLGKVVLYQLSYNRMFRFELFSSSQQHVLLYEPLPGCANQILATLPQMEPDSPPQKIPTSSFTGNTHHKKYSQIYEKSPYPPGFLQTFRSSDSRWIRGFSRA